MIFLICTLVGNDAEHSSLFYVYGCLAIYIYIHTQTYTHIHTYMSLIHTHTHILSMPNTHVEQKRELDPLKLEL